MHILFAFQEILSSIIWTEISIAILTGIISGIISALLFFYLLKIFKPNIKLSQQIAETTIDIKNENGVNVPTKVYFIKIINYTKSNIENVSIDMYVMEEYFNGSGKNYTRRKLKTGNSYFKFIHGTREKDDLIHNNCIQLVIYDDLKEVWDTKKEYLHLQIDATHSGSGRRKVTPQKYSDYNKTVVKGKFDSGHNFKIIPC